MIVLHGKKLNIALTGIPVVSARKMKEKVFPKVDVNIYFSILKWLKRRCTSYCSMESPPLLTPRKKHKKLNRKLQWGAAFKETKGLPH